MNGLIFDHERDMGGETGCYTRTVGWTGEEGPLEWDKPALGRGLTDAEIAERQARDEAMRQRDEAYRKAVHVDSADPGRLFEYDAEQGRVTGIGLAIYADDDGWPCRERRRARGEFVAPLTTDREREIQARIARARKLLEEHEQAPPARRFEPSTATRPPDDADAPFIDDVPEIQINEPTTHPEHEEEPMTAAPTANGETRRIEHEEPTHHVQVAGFAAGELTVEQVKRRVDLIRELMGSVMKEGEHYGKVPGCGDKMVLLKPGAEKLRVVFGLGAAFKIRRTDLPNGHREYEVRCVLRHLATGRVVGEGMGCCSTMESKYRWRKGERVCPKCDAATIMRSRFDDCGWYCNAKRGGCGAKFPLNDPAIEGQQIGRVENPDLADTYNTVLKIAEKRAAVDATLNATGASDLFTQDLDDRQPNADAGSNTRAPFDAAQAAAPATEPAAAPQSLSREHLLKALKGRKLDSNQIRTVYNWFGEQTNWGPSDEQCRMFLADIEAGRFDGGQIRPKHWKQQAA